MPPTFRSWRAQERSTPLASQSTICRVENAPRKTEAARLCAALIDQFGTTVRPGILEILDIDDTFCAAHGAQQLAFWNAHHDERGFASMRAGGNGLEGRGEGVASSFWKTHPRASLARGGGRANSGSTDRSSNHASPRNRASSAPVASLSR